MSTTVAPTSTLTTDYYYDYNTSLTMPCDMDTANVLGTSFRPVLLWLVCVSGSLGNGLVLCVLLMSRVVRGMADVCLLNLALADLMLALLLPLWIHTGTGTGSNAVSPDALCKLKTGVYQLGFTSGLLFVTLMSLDRYLAIVHAVRSSAVRRLRYSLLASATVWAIALTFAAIKAAFYTSEDSQCETTRMWQRMHSFVEVGLCLGFCLPVLTWCYFRILVVVRTQRSSKRDRAIRLIFAIVCVFVLFWVPYSMATLLQTVWTGDCKVSQILELVMEVTEHIALMHSCVNPVIYAFVGEKFRRSFASMFFRYRLCRKLCPCQAGAATYGSSPYSKPSDYETSNTPVSSSRPE